MKRKPDFVLPELGISPHIGSNTTYFVNGDDDYLWYNNAAMAGGRRIKLKRNVGDYNLNLPDAILYTGAPLSTCDLDVDRRIINNAAVSGGRKPVFRAKRKIRSHPLTFRNPFYTTGAKIRIPERSFTRPIRGLSTIGDYANTLRGEPLNSVYKQPLLDRSPQYEGAHSQWTSLLPKGVNSVEARDRRLTAQREIEAQHAGVYSKKEQRMRALQRMMKDWTKAKDMKKIMQLLTEHDELGGIPKKSKDQAKKVMEEFQKKLFTSSKRYLDLMHENDRHPPITTQAMPGAQPAQTPAEAKEQHEEEKTTLADLVSVQARDEESAKKAAEKANEGSEQRAPLSDFGNLTAVKPNVGVSDSPQLLGIYAEPYKKKTNEEILSLFNSYPGDEDLPPDPTYTAPFYPELEEKFRIHRDPISYEDKIRRYFMEKKNGLHDKRVLGIINYALRSKGPLTDNALDLYKKLREEELRFLAQSFPHSDDDLIESHISAFDDND